MSQIWIFEIGIKWIVQGHKIDKDESTKLKNNACIKDFFVDTARLEFKCTELIDEGLEAWNAVMLHWMDIRSSKISITR